MAIFVRAEPTYWSLGSHTRVSGIAKGDRINDWPDWKTGRHRDCEGSEWIGIDVAGHWGGKRWYQQCLFIIGDVCWLYYSDVTFVYLLSMAMNVVVGTRACCSRWQINHGSRWWIKEFGDCYFEYTVLRQLYRRGSAVPLDRTWSRSSGLATWFVPS